MSSGDPSHTGKLFQNLQALKHQENALIQMLTKTNAVLRQLKVEELQILAELGKEKALEEQAQYVAQQDALAGTNLQQTNGAINFHSAPGGSTDVTAGINIGTEDTASPVVQRLAGGQDSTNLTQVQDDGLIAEFDVDADLSLGEILAENLTEK